MKRGPKPQAQYVNGAQTTPIMPTYLSKEAKEIWFEELERVVGAGINESHSSTFARYCSLEAANRAAFAKGEVPRGAYMSEVRKLSEMLGIAGIAGRTTNGGHIDPLAADADPYGALPEG